MGAGHLQFLRNGTVTHVANTLPFTADEHLKLWRFVYVSPQTQHNTTQHRMRLRPEPAGEHVFVPHGGAPTVSTAASGATPLNCQSILPRASADTGGFC